MSARIRTLREFLLAILVAGWAANVSGQTPPAPEYQRDIRPLMERRCLVCHGRYDAPCQLKLDSYQGLARGGTKEQIYSTERLSPASPSRLFEDAQTTAGRRTGETAGPQEAASAAHGEGVTGDLRFFLEPRPAMPASRGIQLFCHPVSPVGDALRTAAAERS